MKQLLPVLLSAIVTSGICAETERELFARTLDALPKASSDEFKTPESVARYFVQGVIDNRIQDTFRCIPLSRLFSVDTFENSTRYAGYTFSGSRDTWPDDDYGRYLNLLMMFHYSPVQRCRVPLLLATDQSKTNLVEEVQRPGDKNPPVADKWMEKLANDLSFRSLTNAVITSVTSKPRKTELKHLDVLPFKDVHVVTVHVSVRKSEIPFTFFVGIVDTNYQIRSLLD